MFPIIFRLVCARTHIHTQIPIPIIHTHAHTRAHIHICVHTYAHTHTHVPVHTCTHKYIHTPTKMGSHNTYYPSHASSKNTLGTFHSGGHRSAPLLVPRARVLFTQVSPGCGDAGVTHRHLCSHSCEHTSLRTCRHIPGSRGHTAHPHWGLRPSLTVCTNLSRGLRRGAGPGPPLRGHSQQRPQAPGPLPTLHRENPTYINHAARRP